MARRKMDTTTIRDLRVEDLPQAAPPHCVSRPTLAGQKAVVTGATSGIGRAIALEFARSGADVVINYIGEASEAEKVAQDIEQCGVPHAGRGVPHRADVSDERQVQDMFRRAVQELGTVDILVNNAGIQKDAAIEEMTLDDWNAVMSVNLTGQFLCAREAIREFKRRGVNPEVSCAAGKIICVSSVHDSIPWAGHVNYAASKGGVALMMKSIAQEAAPWRIRVNSVCPGAIRTSINRDAWASKEAYDELMKLVPYKRIGEIQDVARLAAWVASDEADYIVGAELYIDGGMMLYPGFATGG